jgi:hypothetical protein
MNSNQKIVSAILLLALIGSILISGYNQQHPQQPISIEKVGEFFSHAGKNACRYPVNKIQVSISSARCQELAKECSGWLSIDAQSRQISSLISSGKVPCSEGGYGGCGMSLLVPCGSSFDCSIDDIPAASFFGPAMDDTSISITDKVVYCAFYDGKPLGDCIGSLPDQCNPNAVIKLIIN